MILLDTHVWWWAVSEPTKLSDESRQLIVDTPLGQHYIASISLWEFVMMAKRGKIELTISPSEWLSFALGHLKTQVIPISADIALDSCNLPGQFHKDPADRLITSTARISQLKLITKDRKIRNYQHVETVW